MAAITSQIKEIPKVALRKPLNKPGNYPEYQAWEIVCRKEGKYTSLCFTMDTDPNGTIYQCCSGCEDMRELLNANKIEIEDFWLKSVTG
jgi:anaerobic ribonucleoside-triphosphate reductase